MRTASSALTNLLASRRFLLADLYEFTLADGTVLKYTSWDQDLAGYSSVLGWERTKAKWSTGTQIETMDVTLHATRDTGIIEQIASGMWDGAGAVVKRGFFANLGGSVETALIFSGWVGDITEIGRIKCTLQLQSKKALLNVGIPQGLFQPSCRWVFGSPPCGVDTVALTQIGTVQSGSTATTINTGLTQPGPIAAPIAAPTLSSTTNSAVNLPPNITYYVQVTYVTSTGETTPSPEASLLVTSSQGLLKVSSPPSAANVTGYNVYVGVTSGDEQLQNTTPLSIGSTYTMATGGIYLSGIRPPATNGNGYFALGTIQFTSGANSGSTRVVESNTSSGSTALRVPLFGVVAAGDQFKIVPSCDHTRAQCQGKFNNLIHHGATPFIPTPEVGSA